MSSSCRLLIVGALAGAGPSGCGDNIPGSDAGDPWIDVGDYDRPEDFAREGCAAGGFADADLQGIYHLEIDVEGYTSAGAIRIDDLIGAWGGVVLGRQADQVRTDANDILLRHANPDDGLRALDLCARDGTGIVTGHYVRCPATGDDECYTGTVRGQRVEPLAEPVASGMTLLGELGGWPVGNATVGISINIRVDGDLAYLARYQDGLRIIDVSDPSEPTEIAHLPVEFGDGEIWNDVKLTTGPGDRRYALMASNKVGVVVVDVTTPTAPAIVAHLGTPLPGELIKIHTLFVDGGRAYLANSDVGLEIWDLADPAVPVRLGQFIHPYGSEFTYLHDLYVAGDRAYLNFWDQGMAIVDVSNPAQPQLLGEFDDYGEHTSHSSWVTQIGARKIAVHGDEQFGAHVNIVDVTEGSADFATSIGQWETRPEVSVHNVMAFGSRALLAHYQDGVRVLDLSDPTAPVEVAHYQTWPGYHRAYGYSFFEGVLGVDWDLDRGLVYVADSHRGLLVLQLPD